MKRTCLLLLLIATTLARANTLALCVDANDWVPYTYPRRDGTLQVLAKMAAIRLGESVSFVALPWLRCQKSVESGMLQGMVATSDTDYAVTTFALPRLHGATGALDPSRAMGRQVLARTAWPGAICVRL